MTETRRGLFFDKQQKITSLLTELESQKQKIRRLQSLDLDNLSNLEKLHRQKDLEIALKKNEHLLEQLTALGVKAEKRGRPKKEESEKFKSTHTKLTLHLLPENVQMLKDLKESKKISNISAFIDQLLIHYRENELK